MANDATCIHFILFVTGDAVTHTKIYQRPARRTDHFAHVSMALLTGQFAHRYMSVMGKIHMDGILVKPYPTDILLLLDIMDQFFLFGTF